MMHNIMNEALEYIRLLIETLIPVLLFCKCVEWGAKNLFKNKGKASQREGRDI